MTHADDTFTAPRTLLHAIAVLHARGAQRITIFPFMSPTGLHWRCGIHLDGVRLDKIAYTSASGWQLPGNPSGDKLDAEAAADAIWSTLTDDERERANRPDPAYTAWYTDMLARLGTGFPILYDDSVGPAAYEQGYLAVIGPNRDCIPGNAQVPLPPGDSLKALLERD
ncbi:MAG TPA: hypothetical protein PK781_05045 [Terrimesophilobacter sp.]|nr:hypothetical protein [Terrimesophilobacter sp.]